MKNNIDELYKAFSKHAFFQCFERSEFAKFVSLGQLCEFQKSEFIFEKDMESNAMYILKKGLVKIVSFSEDGKEALLNYVHAGEILGEIGLMDGGPRTASAYCSEPSELIRIPRSKFFGFLDTHPEFYKAAIFQICKYLRWSTETIEDNLFFNRYQRLAKKLLYLKSKQSDEGNIIKISQEELANMLGLSREIVNKSLQELQKKGFILLKRSQILIVKEHQLHFLIEEGDI